MGERKFSLEELAQIVGGILTKASDVTIDKVAPPKLADENTLALAMNEEEIENIASSKAKAVLVPLGVNLDGISTIEVERPRLAFMKLLNVFYIAPDTPKNIHPTAVIDPTAKLGQNVSIGANVFVGRNAGIVIYPHSEIKHKENDRETVINYVHDTDTFVEICFSDDFAMIIIEPNPKYITYDQLLKEIEPIFNKYGWKFGEMENPYIKALKCDVNCLECDDLACNYNLKDNVVYHYVYHRVETD